MRKIIENKTLNVCGVLIRTLDLNTLLSYLSFIKNPKIQSVVISNKFHFKYWITIRKLKTWLLLKCITNTVNG